WHLLAAADISSLLVVATYRDTELDRTHPLSSVLADLRRLDGVERVTLGGLDAVETSSLLDALHADVAPDRVFAETEGNPLFVTEVARHVAESGDGDVPEG